MSPQEITSKTSKWHKLYPAALLLSLLAAWFYWFQLRPAKIRFYCDEAAFDNRYRSVERYDYFYKRCLRSKGLR